MSSFCEDRVCIVTGAGRGIGREHALMLAEHGAKVVVNDLGGSRDGEGSSAGPAQEVVEEIKKAGGRAVANGDDVIGGSGVLPLSVAGTTQIVHDDLGAVLGEHQRVLPANSSSGSRHDDDAILTKTTHVFPPSALSSISVEPRAIR